MSDQNAIDQINTYMKDTMVEHLGIEFTHLSEDLIQAKMPVSNKCRQPYGVMHGGASAVLAETVASVGSHLLVQKDGKKAFGIEVTAQHLRSVREGEVKAEARLIKKGRTLHTWRIDILNGQDELICIAKMIIAIK